MSKKEQKRPLAQVHVHFNIQGDNTVPEGEITSGEYAKAIERFIRWHERQAAIGRELLARLAGAQSPAVTATLDTSSAEALANIP